MISNLFSICVGLNETGELPLVKESRLNVPYNQQVELVHVPMALSVISDVSAGLSGTIYSSHPFLDIKNLITFIRL